MLRKIIEIDEAKCTGCADCIPSCAEGALQIIDGKCRLISDLFCDGLGACIGHCPEGAMTIVEREAAPYDERTVMDTIVKGGPNVIKAHLEHLREHQEFEYLATAKEYLKDNDIANPLDDPRIEPLKAHHKPGGCPGSQTIDFSQEHKPAVDESGQRQSYLKQWPIQLHLVAPQAQYYQNADLLLAADCVSFAYADFHKDFLKGNSLAIACPKLDTNQQVYLDKLISMINEANINSITVMIMQVPCCGGLLQLAKQAAEFTEREVPVKAVVVGINGEILQEANVA